MAQRRTIGKRLTRSLRLLALAGIGFASPASAQILPLGRPGLPPLPAGGLLQTVPSTIDRTAQGADRTLTNTLQTTGSILRDTVGRPHGFGNAIETIDGVQVVRGEVLAIAPSAGDLAAARNLGFTLVRQESFAALGLTAAVLRAPDGMDTDSALAALTKADPAGHYDYNHIYNPSGGGSAAPSAAPATSGAVGVASVGMIDAGLDRDHPAFKQARIESKCFAADGSGPATAHGTAVASLLIGESDSFQGFLRGTALYAADVYCGQAAGGSAEDIVRALAWLAQNRIAVVNISLSGPPNVLLAVATATFIKSGHVLVAAVGNDGPAAPEKYPAAYPGVVGVTSVDGDDEVQLDANRGPDVAFAARGVDVRAATLHGGYATVTGTSFAAPVVTARFAQLVPAPDAIAVARAWLMLEGATHDLGAPGRDPVFGYGLLGAPGAAAESARASSED